MLIKRQNLDLCVGPRTAEVSTHLGMKRTQSLREWEWVGVGVLLGSQVPGEGWVVGLEWARQPGRAEKSHMFLASRSFKVSTLINKSVNLLKLPLKHFLWGWDSLPFHFLWVLNRDPILPNYPFHCMPKVSAGHFSEAKGVLWQTRDHPRHQRHPANLVDLQLLVSFWDGPF